MKIELDDGPSIDLPDGATGLDAARAAGGERAVAPVLVRVDGSIRDLRLPLADGERVQILTSGDRRDADALFVLRHSVAHLLAEAVTRLHPGTRVATGGPSESGFHYDFEFREPLAKDALRQLEAEIEREIQAGREWKRWSESPETARRRFEERDEPYRAELVGAAAAGEEVTFYEQGDFADVCSGPHLLDTSVIDPHAVKLLSVSGAYWRGAEEGPQLTRIRGIAFYDGRDLEAFVRRAEEARRRDHRHLGQELGLFHFDERSPGAVFWHPRGTAIWRELDSLRRRENARRGYAEVKTPFIYDVELFRVSGHWDRFREGMFSFPVGAREFALKAMNCPSHCLVYGSAARSYRELPVRVAEAGELHRNEPSGHLRGLLRTRHFVQDDAHIFCERGQVEDEVLGCLEYALHVYELVGFRVRAELGTRPDERIGSDDDWDAAEAAMRTALGRTTIECEDDRAAGAFYGPQINLSVEDAIGRQWPLGNIQLDFQLPARFGLSYLGPDNVERTPALIHRAVLGSFERFIAILIEHTEGELPVFLAPEQVRVVTVSDRYREGAASIAEKLRAGGIRAGVDDRDETVAKRVRIAEADKVPYIVVWGERESPERLSVRSRHAGERETSVAELLEEIRRARPS